MSEGALVDFKGGNSEDFEVPGASLNDFSICCVLEVIVAVEVAVKVAVKVAVDVAVEVAVAVAVAVDFFYSERFRCGIRRV